MNVFFMNKWKKRIIIQKWLTKLTVLAQTTSLANLIHRQFFFTSLKRKFVCLIHKTIFLPRTPNILIHCSTCSGPDYIMQSIYQSRTKTNFCHFNNEKTQYFIAVILFYWKPFEIRTINVEIINLHWSTYDLHIYNISQ
jgi:hypothetical protein